MGGGASAGPGRDLIFNQFVVENECLRGQPGPLVIATRKYEHRAAFQVPADSSPLDIKGAERERGGSHGEKSKHADTHMAWFGVFCPIN